MTNEKRKAGRPPTRGTTADNRIEFKTTDDELANLHRNAARSDMTITEYIRYRCCR